MATRSGLFSPELQEYVVAHSTGPDELLKELAAETAERTGSNATMQISAEQGPFMTLLARMTGATRAVEIGTFTGYSSICITRGMGAKGRLLCCDVSEEWTSIARRYWEKAGLADQIELRLGAALDTLTALPDGTEFDLAFIDADKGSYSAYWDALVPRVRPGGVISVDNTLWSFKVADRDARDEDDENLKAVREFNDHAAADDRVELVILPIGDGVTLAVKK
ncbi:O-methyltransferase [Spirillospora sp. CA-294931]|uniref:O-methyltransferase n=1 Tax=Spirillospora sp. CA-294931 TaxID=3240042 RepID=UPI003D91C750